MAQIQIISGVERRRRWSEEQKREIVAAAFAPGAVASAVAQQADIPRSSLYKWRQELRTEQTGFAEMVVAPRSGEPRDRGDAAIEVAIGDNAHVRIPPSTPPDLAAAVVKAMVRR
jgi:transposase